MQNVRDLIQGHLEKLCLEIGARPTGSKANQTAVSYAASEFKKIGCEVSLQTFPCMDWKSDWAQLEVDGLTVNVTSAEYSLPCNVSGEVVCVGTRMELADADIHEKICVLYGDLCKEPLMPKNFTFWNPEEHQQIIRQLETKKPLAVITVSYLPDEAVSIIEDGDFSIPCAAVTGKDLAILQTAKNVKLHIAAERKPSESSNVIAVTGKGKKKISFSAHIDTKANTPGALDNASGVAALLALAAKIANKDCSYQIEFVLFNGEDYYSIPGETAYMATYLQNPEEYEYAVNVDGIGMKGSKTSYSFYEVTKELEEHIVSVAQNFSTIEQIDPWPMGDHMLFANSGIPAVAITASNIFTMMETALHTPEDNLSLVDIDKIEETIQFLCSCN